jgi:DNA-binding MarR family transcriptional regulator
MRQPVGPGWAGPSPARANVLCVAPRPSQRAEPQGDDGDDAWPPESLAGSLTFLLKHVQARYGAVVEPAFEHLVIDGRELGVLRVLAGEDGLSQQQAAQRLAVDRTTMVALIDGLEDKGLVVRRPHPRDRRVNVAEVTRAGRAALRKGDAAVAAVDGEFLAPLGEQGARRLKQALLTLLASDQPPGR